MKKNLTVHLLALLTVLLTLFLVACESKTKTTEIINPIIEGYYADPSIIYHDGAYYIYATKDPWGGDDLAVFETTDFTHFVSHSINWPTKTACTSATSSENKVWAPSVIKGKDGRFYMYVSSGSEVWAGSADSPLGPWENMKIDGSPLIERFFFPGYHMIDAEVFIDDDGKVYLYWGSGLNWVNGACFVVQLSDDMHTFIGKPINCTPPNFFEAPFMLKRKGLYYLMYSNGKAIDETYNIRYSTGPTPFGPWTEGKNSPILKTSEDSSVIGPGHHTVFKRAGQYYILYHTIFPQDSSYVLRQLNLDRLNFDGDGVIQQVKNKGAIW